MSHNLVRRRPAFGWTVIAMLITGGFVWATYQRLEHYLLVPFLLTAISAGVALDAIAKGLVALVGRARWRDDPRLVGIAGLAVGLGAIAFAIALAGVNWSASDRSNDRGGDDYVAQLFGALPPNAMIVSYWDPTGPLWYGQHVEGLRPDVQIVDDSNIAYDGRGDTLDWIAAAICERPVFIMRITDKDVQEIRSHYALTKFLTVRSSALGPTAVLNQDVYRVEPPSTCGTAAGTWTDRESGGNDADSSASFSRHAARSVTYHATASVVSWVRKDRAPSGRSPSLILPVSRDLLRHPPRPRPWRPRRRAGPSHPPARRRESRSRGRSGR